MVSAWAALERQARTASDVLLDWSPGRPVVLAIDSEKGGVGKSGLAAGLIAVLAARNLPTLGIDLDPRATLTAELGADDVDGFSVNDLLYEDVNSDPDDLPELTGLAAQAVRPAGAAWGEHVHVLAAERALANRENDNSTPNLEHRLRIALEGVAEQYAAVIIDLPPRAGGKLVGAGLLAATDVLYPATLNEDGQVGVRDALRTSKFMARSNPRSLRKVGVVRNIVEPRTRLAVTYDHALADEFGDDLLDIVIPKRVIRQEARSACVPITIAADKPDARDLIASYTHVLNVVGRL